MKKSDPQPLVIWGASGHALVVVDIIRLQGTYFVSGFLDDISPERAATTFSGVPILGGREQLIPLLQQGCRDILLAFGNCRMRLELSSYLIQMGFTLPVAQHPYATVARDVNIGAGTVIAAGAVVNPAVQIGTSVIINTSSSVDHECVIGDAAHICPGARLAGRVSVGKAAQVGIGAAVIDGIRIGDHAVVGAGAVVTRDVPDHTVAYGVPATIRRTVNE